MSWPLLRLDELRVGDRIEWKEFHEGPLTVNYWGRLNHSQVVMSCDGWSAECILPGDYRVSVDPNRPAADPPYPAPVDA